MFQRKKPNAIKKPAKAGSKSTHTAPDFPQATASAEPSLVTDDVINVIEDYAIIRLDPKGKIHSWNRGAEKIKGYKADEILGKNYRIFYTTEDRKKKRSEDLLDEAAKRGRTNYEGWRLRKDGTRFWGSMTLTALRNEAGAITGFIKVTRDLTAKKVADDQLSNVIEELKAKNKALAESEARYHRMVSEVLDYAIISLDKKGYILDWNKGAEQLKGYTALEIVGKHFRMFYPKEEKEAKIPERLMATAIKKGNAVHEGWRLRKNGGRFWAYVVLTALHDDNGKVIGFSKVTRDLTDKKIAEDRLSNLVEELQQSNDELKQSEQRYQRMVAEVQDYAIILLDVNGKIENWNTGAQYIKGYQPREIIGKHFSVFYPQADQHNGLPERLLSEARMKGRVTHEGWRVRKDGTRFWGSVVITALHDDHDNIIGFSKVTRDLTERKAAEEARERVSEQLDLKNKILERLNSELSSFTYVASHDLKEPLRKIRIFAERIRDEECSPERTDEFLTKIDHSVQRMQSLIDNLLSYSQVTNDESIFEEVDLNEILLAVKNDLEVSILEKHAKVESNRLPSVVGVSFQLHQLFLNLISNALKFSKDNVMPIITIHARKTSNVELPEVLRGDGQHRYHQISFRDNGIGFKPEQGERIFEAFRRLQTKAGTSGTGLGLAIVKKVVENHHGVVSAESRPDEGATFHVYLPSERRV